MQTLTSANTEICRMSWFLIELDEGVRNGIAASGRTAHCIIHSVDLIDSDANNMYLERTIKFRLHNTVLEGKVLLASDDRNVVEQRLKALKQVEANTTVETTRRYLVQYNKGSNNLIHAVLRESDICHSISADELAQRRIMIKDGKLQRMARVLYASEYADIVHEELQRLKNHCFEATFDDADAVEKLPTDAWLLIQYSCSANDVIYAIINQTETVWQSENLYPDVVAYIGDGVNVYQSIILRKSIDRSELDSELQRIKDYSRTYFADHLQSNEHEQDNSNSSDSLHIAEEEEFHSAIDFKNVLEKMEQQMQREAAMIAEAFEAIDRVRRTMERRLYMLNNP